MHERVHEQIIIRKSENMYRITKVLNHNAVMAVKDGTSEYLIMGKGIGFGKKISEEINPSESDTVYSLQSEGERGSASDIVKTTDPDCLEIADFILNNAEKKFGKVDRDIIFPMADHLQYALRRMEINEELKNDLNDDIRIIYHEEYEIAAGSREIVKKIKGLELTDDEIGYIALHIHSAIQEENVSQAMIAAQLVRACADAIGSRTGKKIEVRSLDYNRLINHIRYMVIRMQTGEKLKLNMNDYMIIKFPKTFAIAEDVCRKMSDLMKLPYDSAEVGYLAMHIERVGGTNI